MEKLDHYLRLLAYNDWANREALASLERAAPPPERALERMAHVVAAEWLWLSRLRAAAGEAAEAPLPVWPRLTPAECAAYLADLPGAWRAYLGRLDDAALGQTAAYTNTQGEPWENRIDDIVMHVVMHGAYHRGQIAADLRAAGYTPVLTDFIHAVRQGFVP